MNNIFSCFIKNSDHFYTKMSQIYCGSIRFLFSKVNSLWVYLSYFITFSFIGFLALKFTNTKNTTSSSFTPNDFDVFFTSVSSVTASSMSTVEMEVFSNTQLIFMTILMFLGGEIFLSLLELLVTYYKYFPNNQNIINPDQIELGLSRPNSMELDPNSTLSRSSSENDNIKYKSIRYLCYVILSYILVVHVCGYSVVSLYMSFVPSAKQVLENKGLQLHTFSIFTTVSTFSNCGFIPTNENMIVFKKNSGLLLLLIPQILLGNTLYPICLRFLIWVMKKITKRVEFEYILKNCKEMRYNHFFSGFQTSVLGVTAFGFIVIQMVLFCSLEWNSKEIDGLSSYKKFVASFFQIINSRHSGETVVDIANISSAMLVLFVVMMYLPPYASFLSTSNTEKDSRNCKQKSYGECLIFSPLCVLVTFITIICITEKDKMKNDPVNFNVLNVTIEVISAYSNVGFSTGYHCNMQVKPENSCTNTGYGFVGRWSNKGKLILIIVMFYGKLRKLTRKAGEV